MEQEDLPDFLVPKAMCNMKLRKFYLLEQLSPLTNNIKEEMRTLGSGKTGLQNHQGNLTIVKCGNHDRYMRAKHTSMKL